MPLAFCVADLNLHEDYAYNAKLYRFGSLIRGRQKSALIISVANGIIFISTFQI